MAAMGVSLKAVLGSEGHAANFLDVDPQCTGSDIARRASDSLDLAFKDYLQKLLHRDTCPHGALRQRHPSEW